MREREIRGGRGGGGGQTETLSDSERDRSVQRQS